MVDMLELTGSTTAAAEQLGISQSSVSRRYRALAGDLELMHDPSAVIGKRYGSTEWMRTLRQGVNSHRLARGVLRLGAPMELWPCCKDQPWCHWVGLPSTAMEEWRQLFKEELLDGVVMGRPAKTDETVAVYQSRLPTGCAPDPLTWLIIRAHEPVINIVKAIGSQPNDWKGSQTVNRSKSRPQD